MKRFILTAVVLFIMAALSGNLFASESINEVNAVSAASTSTVSGTLTRVYMNGEKTSGQSVTGTVTDNGDGTINITLDEFKVGKMPGYISVEANNIPVTGSSFNESLVENAVKLRIISTSSFDASIAGTYDGTNLVFTVSTVDAKYLGVSFQAIVTFNGSK